MKSLGGKGLKGISVLLYPLLITFALILPVYGADLSSHDRARQALNAGEILPLKTVLEKVGRDMPGQVMEIELERKRDRLVYEIKLMRAGGSLVKLDVDARDGSIIPRRGPVGTPTP